MKKIIIHIEEIKKLNAKVQFQIKLPSTAFQVIGILVTLHPINQTQVEVPRGEPRPENMGALWLRIPEKRDVFFADSVRQSNHLLTEYQAIPQQGLSTQAEWWFIGKKHSFFNVTIPVEDTLIECFYKDESTTPDADYQLKIYLELQLND